MPSSHPSEAERPRPAARRRALAGCVVLVVLLHAALFRAAGQASLGADRAPAAGASMAVRAIEAPAAPTAEPAPIAAPPPAAPPPRPRVARAPREPRRTPPDGSPPIEAAASALPIASAEPAASMPSAEPPIAMASTGAIEPAPTVPREPIEPSVEPASAAVSSATSPAPGASAVDGAASATFLVPGEQPPPTYRTVLPPAATLHYEVRRGFFRGTGEIRWAPAGDRYALRLEARLAGITLLAQTSEGETGETGLAPTRFLDQRVRRAPQAANFRREAGRIGFSGPSTEWPLLPGTQDRLSWMIQLVGIVAADPGLATEGGRISMVLVGARGEAGVRTLRFVGRENAETAGGSVPALKFVVDPRAAYEGSYEIWLDPARGYLPVHATSRNGAGESEFDLLLQRIEP